MSDDVQMAPGVKIWRRGLPLWDGYFALIAGITAVATLAAGNALAAGLIAAMAVWYVAFGRRLIVTGTYAQGFVYMAGVLVLLVSAIVVDDRSAFMLWVLSPHALMVVPLRWGMAFAAVFNLVLPGVMLARGRSLAHVAGSHLALSLTAFVGTVVIGVIIRRLIAQSHELYESRSELARLSREAERQRLAGDIHDTVAQGLSSMVMLIQAAEASLDRDREETRRHLDLAARTARDNLNEIRAVLDAITPATPDLEAALRRLAARFAEETGVVAALEVDGPARQLPTPVEVMLLRAAQESLSNVRRHAGATSAALRLSYEDSTVRLAVRDDGCGFDVSQSFGGYGLEGMRNRVEQVGGSLRVSSAPGETLVTVAAPA